MAAIGRLRLRETARTTEAWLVCSPLRDCSERRGRSQIRDCSERRGRSQIRDCSKRRGRSQIRDCSPPRGGAEQVIGALVRADEACPEVSLRDGARVQRHRARLPITPCRLAVDATRGGVARCVQRESGHGGREELKRIEEERAAHALHRIVLKHARAYRNKAAAEHLAGGAAARR